MKEILLCKTGKNAGKYVAIVDDEDYDELNKFNWWVKFSSSGVMYAVRSTWLEEVGKNGPKIYMHRQILKIQEAKMHVDHVNRNGLDNRKINIRACTRSENQKNRRAHGSSKYLGVHFTKLKSNFVRKDGTINPKTYPKWVAKIKENGRHKHLGFFDNEIDAALAYDKAAKEIHLEFANLNFKEGVPI